MRKYENFNYQLYLTISRFFYHFSLIINVYNQRNLIKNITFR